MGKNPEAENCSVDQLIIILVPNKKATHFPFNCQNIFKNTMTNLKKVVVFKKKSI